jgi:hypothetical protein
MRLAVRRYAWPGTNVQQHESVIVETLAKPGRGNQQGVGEGHWKSEE